VVLSTAVIERVTIFDLLLAHGGKLTTSQITESLNTSNPTAKRTMAEFKALGLVQMSRTNPEQTNSEMQIVLKDDFNWFLTEAFQKLREGYEPSDNREYLKTLKEKSPASEG
jgi:DNA-binding transcriptional regulator GbsR (MarR family)